MTPVAAPADKRFRRAHVHPARKRSWVPRWRPLLAILAGCGLAGFGLYRGAGLALSAEGLTISRITVHGTSRMSPGEVHAVLEDLRGRSMVTANLEAWRLRLLEAPWVEDAAIRRVFPGTVSVVISEREPLGIGRIGGGLYLIDARGEIIDEFGPAYADFDLPIIDGLAAAPKGSTLVDAGRAALAGRLLRDIQRAPRIAARVSQIDVSDARDAVVILEGDPTLIHLGDDAFAERVQAYLDLAPRFREQVPDMEYADMRFGDRVYVRPHAPGPAARPARLAQ
jgi:cell division protein FtsQ